MNKKIKNRRNKQSHLFNFEKELYVNMKTYGFLFPENFEEVKKFEELFGQTPINTPETFELMPSKKVILNFDLGNEFKLAAFTPPPDDSAPTSNDTSDIS